MKFIERTVTGMVTTASVLLALALLAPGLLQVTVHAIAAQEHPAAPDNTKANKGDENSSVATADRQKENAADRETTRQIRRALINDKGLSTYAHNVKIITRDGIVTLRGPVRSEDEKQTVEAKAKEVAGADKVTSYIEVKPKS